MDIVYDQNILHVDLGEPKKACRFTFYFISVRIDRLSKMSFIVFLPVKYALKYYMRFFNGNLFRMGK